MRWPPWSPSSSPDEPTPSPSSKPKTTSPPPQNTWPNTLNATDWTHYTSPSVLVPTFLLTATIIGSWGFYRSYLRRIPGAAYVKPSAFRKRSLFGTVTRVGDGDNFHLFHTPGGRMAGWEWMRKVPEWSGKDKRTIAIRIAGIDAPEGAHFGKTAQPFAKESLQWLRDYILHRRVRAYVYRRDQYDRIVATVYIRTWGGLIKRDVGLQMLKAGLATVYEAKTGAEFGELEKEYRAAEATAKQKKKGIWSTANFESPREYKIRTAAEEEMHAKKGDGKTGAKVEGRSWLSFLMPWKTDKK